MFACYLSTTNPYKNLGLEELIFDAVRKDYQGKYLQGGILLWVDKPCVVVGKYQNICAEVNLPYIYKHHILLLRRISGGGCVYHDYGNLNYSFILPKKRGVFSGVVEYQNIVADILRGMGLAVVVNKRGDILLNNKKISGCAQRICGDWLLHHGTLLFAADKLSLQQSLKLDAGVTVSDFAPSSVPSAVTNIADEMAGMVKNQFYQHIFKQLGKKLSATKVDVEKIVSVEDVKKIFKKNKSWDWLYRQNPAFKLQQNIKITNIGLVKMNIEIKLGRVVACSFWSAKENLPILEAESSLFVGQNFELTTLQNLLNKIGDKWSVAKHLAGCQIFRKTK